MRPTSLRWLTVIMLANSAFASMSLADPTSVRLGAHFRDAVGYQMSGFGSVAEVLWRLNLGAQLFVKNVENCQDLLAVLPGHWHGYDTLRNTDTIIQSIKIECWAVLQVDPAASVAATGPADRITPGMMRGVMENAERLSAGDDLWRQTLTSFPGGDITCKDAERCRLSLPDGRNPPEQSLEFDLILAMADERFIRVVQMVYGRAGFVYGVHWHDTGDGGAVISIFPDLR